MIEGVVNPAYEAVIEITLNDQSGQPMEIEAVIDTGYTGFLTLPTSLVTELGLTFRSHGLAVLADSSEVAFDIYDVTILWDERRRRIRVDATGDTPLVGMLLLEGYNLNMDIEQSGTVIISAKD